MYALKKLWNVVGIEARALAVIAVGLIVGEVAMRMCENHLSQDVAHLKSLGALAGEMRVPSSEPRILFLGNSMTRFGVAQPVFASEFHERTQRTPRTVKITPDNTSLSDWFYLYKKFFHSAGIRPDLLVIGFEGNHLQDQSPNHPDRLAHYYSQLSDWKELCHYDLPTLEHRVSFLLASFSSIFGNRDRPQAKAMDLLIPHYRDGLQTLYDRINLRTNHAMLQPEYERLRSFLKMVKSDGVNLVFVAMPIAVEYQLDKQLLEILKEADVRLVDCRHVPGIVPEMFPDGIHMTPDASQLYSRYLADAVSVPEPRPSRFNAAR